MKLKGIIVDADFCIKVGASPKYRYLERVLEERYCSHHAKIRPAVNVTRFALHTKCKKRILALQNSGFALQNTSRDSNVCQ